MDRIKPTESSENLRRGLKNADNLELPMNDDFFDRLHDKIMAEVEKVEIQPSPVLMTPRRLLQAHGRDWLYPAGGILSLFFLSSVLLTQVSKVNQSMQRIGLFSDGHERIVAEALLDPENLSQTLISSQNESDFFMDVASESSENLTVAKFNKLMGERPR